ncbi:MAG: N-succinylarginine dihydrolase [Caulobacteraceae bacterium]|nr:N-succinylarginine dihydrolase [Caulobacteraceae bacterium]
MTTVEINFDGLVGPTHNYAGLSLGNLASASNAGAVARPRAAALQGLEKMRRVMDLGVAQGFFPPPLRPTPAPLRAAGFQGSDAEVLAAAAKADPALFRAACAASSMWTANAATVIAEADSGDGRLHLVTANLASMLHRAVEAEETHALLRAVFADQDRFAVHPPLPLGVHFGDEGAANHMRLTPSHGERGLNVFVFGRPRGGPFPERQALRASQAGARLAGLGAEEAVFALQSGEAVAAGAFHNDVVAVSNERVLLAHPEAFDRPEILYEAIRGHVAGAEIIEVQDISLADAVSTYLFNSQIVTLPGGGMALILPAEVRENPGVWEALQRALGGSSAITEVVVVDVRESMRNGGGPACLRLRVPASEAARAAIRPGYLLTPARWDQLAALVERLWPESVGPEDLLEPDLWAAARAADAALRDFVRCA